MCGALTTRSPSRVKIAQAEIQSLFDVDAARCVPQCDAHLFGDRFEMSIEDLQRNGIAIGGGRSRETWILIGDQKLAAG